MEPRPVPPIPYAPRYAAFIMLFALFVGFSLVAICRRQPWYDEFYSYYLARPGVPLSLQGPAWMRDNHPPVFYALAWAWARLVAPLGLAGSVEGLRTINLAILAALVMVLARYARIGAWWSRIVWFYALALAGMLPAIDRIDQLRSYFLSYALTALVLIALLRIMRGEATSPLRLGAVLALAFAVHLITTVVIAGLVCGVVALLIVTRRWGEARGLTLVAALAFVPFAVMMALQLPTILANTTVFWIPGGFNAGRWAIELEVQDSVTANPLLTLIALAGLALAAMRAWRGDAEARVVLMQIVALGLGFALALAVLFAAHLHRPLLITRYLVALDPVVALVLALLVEMLTRRLRRPLGLVLDGLLLLGTAAALVAGLAVTRAEPGWDGTARLVAAVVRQCPATRVYPNMHWNALTLTMAPRDNRAILPFSYRFVAARYGFRLADGHTMAQGCPTLFWTEHVASRHPSAQAVIRDLTARGYPVRTGRMRRIGDGWVLIAS